MYRNGPAGGPDATRKVWDMESTHIDNRKLYEAVANSVVLSSSEMEHLKECRECLELMRVLVRQQLQTPKTAAE